MQRWGPAPSTSTSSGSTASPSTSPTCRSPTPGCSSARSCRRPCSTWRPTWPTRRWRRARRGWSGSTAVSTVEEPPVAWRGPAPGRMTWHPCASSDQDGRAARWPSPSPRPAGRSRASAGATTWRRGGHRCRPAGPRHPRCGRRRGGRRGEPAPGTVVAHLAGSLGLDVLDPHQHRASLHPLSPSPDPTGGASARGGRVVRRGGRRPERLVQQVVADLGGRCDRGGRRARAAYHAAAVASNHLVALIGSGGAGGRRHRGVPGRPISTSCGHGRQRRGDRAPPLRSPVRWPEATRPPSPATSPRSPRRAGRLRGDGRRGPAPLADDPPPSGTPDGGRRCLGA
jgi:hypothetical protein